MEVRIPLGTESHRHVQVQKGTTTTIAVGDVVIVHDENRPRGLWKLGQVQQLLPSTDGQIRGVVVKVSSGDGHTFLRRPIQRLYPLEVRGKVETTDPDSPQVSVETPTNVAKLTDDAQLPPVRPQRRAALRSRKRVQTWAQELDMD